MSKTLALGILSVVMVVALTASERAPQGTGAASRKVTKEQFEQWKKDLNNWGRWGKDDEIGTGAPPAVGAPVPLFTTRAVAPAGVGRQQYDVSADGQRFLINNRTDDATTAPITLLLNGKPKGQ